MNWRRGFYRIWVGCSVIWVLLAGAAAIGETNRQHEFDERVAAAQTLTPQEKELGLIPELNSHGDRCKSDWFENHAPGVTDPCMIDPPEPHSRRDLVGYWSALFLVPAVFYSLMRGAGWILGGFAR